MRDVCIGLAVASFGRAVTPPPKAPATPDVTTSEVRTETPLAVRDAGTAREREREDVEECLERVAVGDGSAIFQLYELVAPRIFACMLRVTARVHVANALTHEVFQRAHRARGAFKDGADATAWLYAIAHHALAAFEARDGRSSVRRADLDPPAPEQLGADQPAGGATALDRLDREAWCKVDFALREAYAFELDGSLPPEEWAEVVQCTEVEWLKRVHDAHVCVKTLAARGSDVGSWQASAGAAMPTPLPRRSLARSLNRQAVSKRRRSVARTVFLLQIAWLVRAGVAQRAQSPVSWVLAGFVLPLCAALVAWWASMHPGRIGLGLRPKRLAWAASLAAVVFVVGAWVQPSIIHRPNADGHVGFSAVRCALESLGLAAVPLAVGALTLRRSRVGAAGAASACFAVACGVLGAVMMRLHCGRDAFGHVAAVHGSAIAVAAFAGAVIGRLNARV